MLRVGSRTDVAKARKAVALIGRLSDNIIGFKHFGLGLDGVLAWIPGLGEIYSLAAGGLLALLAVRVRAPLSVVVKIVLLILLRSAAGAPASALLGPLYPLSGVVVDLFRGHKWSADLLLKAIDSTVYVEGRPDDPDVGADPIPEAQAPGGAARRVVYLG